MCKVSCLAKKIQYSKLLSGSVKTKYFYFVFRSEFNNAVMTADASLVGLGRMGFEMF